MTPSERNANAVSPDPPARGRRIAFRSHSSYMTLSHDENASPPSRKATPRSSHLFVQTRASAAKAATQAPSRRLATPPARALSPSAGPRRPPTPLSAFTSLSLTYRTASAGTMSRTPTPLQSDDRRLSSTPSVRAQSRIPSFISPAPAAASSASTPHSQTAPLSQPMSALSDKPLPSRPIASVASTLSPSKDGRGLIDAIEKPLKISLGGDHHDWPALTPRSVSAPERKDGDFSQTPNMTPSLLPKRVASHATLTSEMDESAKPRDSKMSSMAERSSTPSFVSATGSEDKASQYSSSSRHSSIHQNGRGVGNMGRSIRAKPSFPPPDSSRNGHQSSRGAVSSRKEGSMRFDTTTRSSSSPSPNSLYHHPSSASFSRPRPGSTSRRPTLPSTDHGPRHQRTASRIPISGSKKPTLVDIPLHNAGPRPGASPSFGARRLVSPNALKIPDQGTKRRQLQRANTDAGTVSESSTPIQASDEYYSAANQSLGSTPDYASGLSASNEDEVPTSIAEAHGSRRESSNGDWFLKLQRHKPQGIVPKAWEEEGARIQRPPPSCSPYTGPLQTITSQAVFPAQDESLTSSPASVPQPVNLADLIQAYGDFDDYSSANEESSARENQRITSETEDAIVSMLSETRGMSLSPQLSAPEQNMQATDDRTRALSLLEGHGTPPNTEVASEDANKYFEHAQLPSGYRNRASRGSLIEKMAAAERFLAQGSPPDDADYLKQTGMLAEGSSKPLTLNAAMRSDQPIASLGSVRAPIVKSKWSDTTPSALGHSAKDSGDNASSQSPTTQEEPLRSIGFPSSSSRLPVAALSNIQGLKNSRTSSHHLRSGSSPTLGHGNEAKKSPPGSVRVAREGISARKGYATATAATESRRNTRNRVSATGSAPGQEDDQRGRRSIAEDTRMKSVASGNPKESRSTSRGKLVLRKINGFFSGRRDKTNQSPPPVPAIPTNFASASSREQSQRLVKPSKYGYSITREPIRKASTRPAWPSGDVRRASHMTDASSTGSSAAESPSGDNHVQRLTNKLRAKAGQEQDAARKLRLLEFAQILSDCMIHAGEARKYAEEAKKAAMQAATARNIVTTGYTAIQKAARGILEESTRL